MTTTTLLPILNAPTPHEADAGWVTFSRTWHTGLGRWVVTQKRDGSTRCLIR